MSSELQKDRRRLLAASLSIFGVSLFYPFASLRGAESVRTPRQSRGPFYPVQIPLDSDNDLVTVEGRAAKAEGKITNIVGRVLDERGRPVSRARIEIWQCNAHGRYHHPRDRRDVPLDPNFQGYGQFVTRDDGAYRFRTIKPVPYPGRAPHIHFALQGPGFEPLVTQMYVKGAPENKWDFILNRISDVRARNSVIVAFESPAKRSGELLAHFDVVLALDGRFGKG